EAHKTAVLGFMEQRGVMGDQTWFREVPNIVQGFGVVDAVKLDEHTQKAWKVIQREDAINLNVAIAALKDESKKPELNMPLMLQMAAEIESKWGPDAIGDQLSSLLSAAVKSVSDKLSDQALLDIFIPGDGIQGLSKEDTQRGFELYKQYLDTRTDMSPEMRDGLLMRYWKSSDAEDSQVKRKWGVVATQPMVGDQVNAEYVKMIEESAKYFAADELKAASMIGTGVPLQRFLAIQRSMAASGISAEQAIARWQDPKRLKSAEDYQKYQSREDVKKIREELESTSGGWMSWLGGEPEWKGAKLPLWMIDHIEEVATDIAAQSQSTEGVVETAVVQLRKSIENINGNIVLTGNKKMKERLGVLAEPSEVIKSFLQTATAPQGVFEGFDPTKISMRVSAQFDTATFYQLDDNGHEVEGDSNNNFGVGIPISMIGEDYKTRTLEKKAAEAGDERQRELDRIKRTVISRDKSDGTVRTQEELDALAEKILNDNATTETWRKSLAIGLLATGEKVATNLDTNLNAAERGILFPGVGPAAQGIEAVGTVLGKQFQAFSDKLFNITPK
ncbi:MAG: hypothetical protein ACYC0V_21320, partial [Armatimonadota bacterium]